MSQNMLSSIRTFGKVLKWTHFHNFSKVRKLHHGLYPTVIRQQTDCPKRHWATPNDAEFERSKDYPYGETTPCPACLDVWMSPNNSGSYFFVLVFFWLTWLPHWDEALDESTGIIEAVYFAPHLYGGRSPPYNFSAKCTASIIPVDSSKASSQWGKQPPSIGMNLIPMARGLGMNQLAIGMIHPNHPND